MSSSAPTEQPSPAGRSTSPAPTKQLSPVGESASPAPSALESRVSKYLELVVDNAILMVEYNFGAHGFYPLFRAVEPLVAGERIFSQALLSFILTLLALIGFVAALRERMTLAEIVVPISLIIAMSWVVASFRFTMPFLPFVVFYMLLGLHAIHRVIQKSWRRRQQPVQWVPLSIAIWGIVAFNAFSHAEYILSLHGPTAERPAWSRAFDENEVMIKWVGEHLPKETALACQNPALVHLYTGHKTVGFADPATKQELWKRLGVRYGVKTAYRPLDEPSEGEKKYPLLYLSERMKLRVLDLGDPATRASGVEAA